ncbi:YHS domain-containing protein, partial [Devosia naphthalenivorans]|uniref:YHS domain-containing protein n=1 Tax=Devosia naphthalenivorans TaxID=2082392 RepID=UPI000DF1889B
MATSHHHDDHAHHNHQDGSSDASVVDVTDIRDPVCGMKVDPASAKHKVTYEGATYYFCSEGCRSKFMIDPAKYTEPHAVDIPSTKTETPEPAGTIWTCPMHPQIRRDEPGSCPICGMALEPELPTADTGPSPELRDMTRRFWIGTALAVPVFVLEMSAHLFDIHHWVAPQTLNWMQLVLATPVVLWAGWPFFERGWASLQNRSLNMFTLIAMGIGVAWLYSIVATLLPGMFPDSMR